MTTESEPHAEIDRALEGLSLSASVLEQLRSLLPRVLPPPSIEQVAPFAAGLARLERAVETLRACLPGARNGPVELTAAAGELPTLEGRVPARCCRGSIHRSASRRCWGSSAS